LVTKEETSDDRKREEEESKNAQEDLINNSTMVDDPQPSADLLPSSQPHQPPQRRVPQPAVTQCGVIKNREHLGPLNSR